jgi:eukaryotic-like serine/threonine-protein kinase
MHHHGGSPQESRILMLRMDRADEKPEVFLEEDYRAEGATFSPDGRHVVFLSDATGQREIYIRPYPGPGEQLTVSVGGGQEPVWVANGDVFYRSLTGQRMFAVSVTADPKLKVGAPIEVFRGSYYVAPTGSPRPQYGVTPDGQRFLMLAPGPGKDSPTADRRIVVVQNWFEELRRLLPTN